MSAPDPNERRGSTRREDSDDAIVSRDYLEEAFRGVYARLDAMDKAVGLAAQVVDRRLHELNQVHERIERLSGTFPTKDECESKHKALGETVKSLELFKAAVDAKASQASVYFFGALTVLSLILAVASLMEKIAK